ncbi:unnamed protein product [Cyclocybe aegerita]|uniref:Uncharacterized protein n=1 Tax=Cyclocybe aegerita TaxID=1973307 RepID=A0A8S0W4V2_CYCAE|nr:unnamed protein product [Cyclocybe aegerita]
MLTLFKPWRSGLDLKNATQTWDNAFYLHEFSPRQKEIIGNFNLRYECNDSRDDYSAKLKKDSLTTGLMSSWMTDEEVHKLDDTKGIMEYNDDGPVIDFDEDNFLPDLLNEDSYCEKEMADIQKVITDIGWLSKLKNLSPIDISSIQLQDIIPSTKWNIIVATAKQLILRKRNEHLPSSSSKSEDIEAGDGYVDEVVVSPMSYIDKKFKAKQAEEQTFIDETVSEFSLNEEQEQAFCIVANHATLQKVEQLKMYLGGMGGTGKSQVIKALILFFAKRKESH